MFDAVAGMNCPIVARAGLSGLVVISDDWGGVVFMRAQVSVDFIIASLIAISIFTVVFAVYSTKSRGIGDAMSHLEAQRIGENLAWAINSVERGGDGASAEVFLPDRIWGEDYYAQVEGRWVEIVWLHGGGENRLSVPLMTSSTKPSKLSPNSRVGITNRGGIVDAA